MVANLRPEAFGNANSTGTRQFRAGALLYVIETNWDRVTVIGHHRKSKRLLSLIMAADRLVNWRVKPVYHPGVLRRLGTRWPDKATCEAYVASKPETIPDLRDEITRKNHALQLLDEDPEGLVRMATAALGLWTKRHENPPIEVYVLADWLEERGVPIEVRELVRTLDRRRTAL